MRDCVYSAVFGALSNEHRMDTIANNLANVNTTGYKKDKSAFHDTFLRFAHDYLVDPKPYLRDKDLFPEPSVLTKPRLADETIDFTQGSMTPTGNPLDFAISGDGFFKVRTDDGDYFTRTGSFSLAADGTLITEQGYEVLGQGGAIVIPPGAPPEVDSSGQIRVDGQVISQMDLMTVSDLKAMEKVGSNLYRIGEDSPNVQEVVAENAQVNQGFIEKSNVEVVTEMVNMMETQRAFEAYAKIMSTSDQLEKTLQMRVGMVR